MLTLLLLAAALPPIAQGSTARSAVDAERAFARDAQRLGQWTAFRKYADVDAVMFTPQVTWAHEFLKGRKNPPASVRWWPAQSYVSCDGRIAVNTGPSLSSDGKSPGYFTTVWQREKRRWLWVYDAGDSLKIARPIPRRPFVRRASCAGKPTQPPLLSLSAPGKRRGKGAPDDYGVGRSADETLVWDWKVDAKGARQFRTFLWNGSRYEQVVHDAAASRK
jgi:hypothetical protein